MSSSYAELSAEREKRQMAEDYHEQCSQETLHGFIDNENELTRINKWRSSKLTQDQLNRVIRMAIQLRQENGLP